MEGEGVQTDLGSIETLLGNLQFTFVLNPEGDAHIQVNAENPTGAGRTSVIIMLDANGFERLKSIVRGADRLIDRMLAEGRIKRMVTPY